MPRFALKIEYDGSPFAGWQKQKSHASVQETIEAAIGRLEASDGIAAAGRTDAGVHAFGQVAHVDLTRDWTPFRLSEALNFHLKPHPVAIVGVARVGDDFHARFSAVERQYLYRLVSRRPPLTFEVGQAWRVGHDLCPKAMQEGANVLLGNHDFTTFRSVDCQAPSPVKTLDELRIETRALDVGTEYRFHVRARSFLHSQVRSFVGTLERVGSGHWTPADVQKALDARSRSACGPVAPAHGLYLANVRYGTDPFADGIQADDTGN